MLTTKIEVNYDDCVLANFLKTLSSENVKDIRLMHTVSGLIASPAITGALDKDYIFDVLSPKSKQHILFIFVQGQDILNIIDNGLDQLFFGHDPDEPSNRYLYLNKRKFIWSH